MCWITITPANGVKKIADKDIKTFKVVKLKDDSSLISAFQDFKYDIGKEYTCELDTAENLNLVGGYTAKVNKGFHSYSVDGGIVAVSKCNYMMRTTFIIRVKFNGIEVDSYTTWDKVRYYVRLNCTIPKGAEYYLNEKGMYVSNRIRVDSVEELNKY